MRILQINVCSGWGCTGRIVEEINNALKMQGHEGIIAWGRINTTSENVKTIKIGNKFDQQRHGLYTRITDKCGFGSKRVTKEFLQKVDAYKPSLIQLHVLHGYYINLEELFMYIKKRGIPVVWTFHDCWAFTGHCPYFDFAHCEKWKTGCHHCGQKNRHPTSWILDNSKWNWKKKKELFMGIDMTIVTPSEWLAGLVKQSFLKDYRLEIINNGINLDDFKPTYGDIVSNLGLKKQKIVLGVSSTWNKSKGMEDFIQLSKLLPSGYTIVLVGLTQTQKKVLPKEIVGIERTDSVSELAELYTAAAVFVNATYEDNYPTTNLEALACGTPVVSYRTGGSVEVAGDRYGQIIEQGNVMALSKYIQSEEWKMKTSIISDMKKDVLDAKVKYSQYIKLYENIVEGTARKISC